MSIVDFLIIAVAIWVAGIGIVLTLKKLLKYAISMTFALFLLSVLSIVMPDAGKPFTKLSNNTVYTKFFDGQKDGIRILGIHDEKGNVVEALKDVVYYQIPNEQLVDSQHQLVTELPRRFKILVEKTAKKKFYIVIKAD